MPRSTPPTPSTPTPANDPSDTVLDVNEKILKQVYDAYSRVAPSTKGQTKVNGGAGLSLSWLRPREEGILAICQKIGIACIAPRRKINVMIVGNHSAGKSSYIKSITTSRRGTSAACFIAEILGSLSCGAAGTLANMCSVLLWPLRRRVSLSVRPTACVVIGPRCRWQHNVRNPV